MIGLDTEGRRVDQTYRVLHDSTFEKRLKLFDPRLRLLFDHNRKRWMILEKSYDNSGLNIILVAEDSEKKEKPLGEWVFNELWVKRKRYEDKVRMGANRWFDDLKYQSKKFKEHERMKASEEHRAHLADDITQWRKASKAIQGLPVSDATAGYSK